jgi:hypothetical protein
MFTDEHGESTGISMMGIGGNWSAHGQPRWRGYLLWGTSVVGGIILALTPGPGGFDLLAMGGILFLVIGILGFIEVLRGRPFRRPG